MNGRDSSAGLSACAACDRLAPLSDPFSLMTSAERCEFGPSKSIKGRRIVNSFHINHVYSTLGIFSDWHEANELLQWIEAGLAVCAHPICAAAGPLRIVVCKKRHRREMYLTNWLQRSGPIRGHQAEDFMVQWIPTLWNVSSSTNTINP